MTEEWACGPARCLRGYHCSCVWPGAKQVPPLSPRPRRVPELRPPRRLPIPAGTAPIEPGRYEIPKSEWSVVDFAVRFPKGWTVQDGHTYLKHSDRDDELSFYAVQVDQIYTDACQGGEDFTEVGPGVYDLAEALLKQPGP